METKYMESMIHRFNTLKQLEPLCAGVHRGSQTITVDAGSTGTRILITKEDGLQLNETFDTD